MLGIYIHFPYCVHKCFYCDFYSLEDFSTMNIFTEYLLKEIELATDKFFQTKQSIDTIYFGGGTPSLINPSHLEKILNFIMLVKKLKLRLKQIPEQLTKNI